MKKIAVLSDTHDILRPQVLDLASSCDAVIHAGDFTNESVLDALRNVSNVYVVKGNNDRDWSRRLQKRLRFEIEGFHFFLTHIRSDVDTNLDGIDIVIFGHTHKYSEQWIDGRLWLNPGACGRPRFGNELTMAILTLKASTHTLEVEKIHVPNENFSY